MHEPIAHLLSRPHRLEIGLPSIPPGAIDKVMKMVAQRRKSETGMSVNARLQLVQNLSIGANSTSTSAENDLSSKPNAAPSSTNTKYNQNTIQAGKKRSRADAQTTREESSLFSAKAREIQTTSRAYNNGWDTGSSEDEQNVSNVTSASKRAKGRGGGVKNRRDAPKKSSQTGLLASERDERNERAPHRGRRNYGHGRGNSHADVRRLESNSKRNVSSTNERKSGRSRSPLRTSNNGREGSVKNTSTKGRNAESIVHRAEKRRRLDVPEDRPKKNATENTIVDWAQAWDQSQKGKGKKGSLQKGDKPRREYEIGAQRGSDSENICPPVVKGKGKKGKGKNRSALEPCFAYQNGRCTRGSDCRFAHIDDDKTHMNKGRKGGKGAVATGANTYPIQSTSTSSSSSFPDSYNATTPSPAPSPEYIDYVQQYYLAPLQAQAAAQARHEYNTMMVQNQVAALYGLDAAGQPNYVAGYHASLGVDEDSVLGTNLDQSYDGAYTGDWAEQDWNEEENAYFLSQLIYHCSV